MSKKIHEGYTIKPRKILKSDIWQQKPSWWLKVWDYFIIKVNHRNNDYFKRGTNFFTYEMIHYDCRLVNDRVKVRNLDNLVRWLKRTTQITTQKTTRGFIVTVCNYEFYQNPKNYENDTENDTGNETQTKHKRNTNDTINKNERMKECKKLTPLQEVVEYFIKKQNIKLETKEAVSEYFKRHGKAASALLKLSGDVKKALSEIDRVSGELDSRGLNWTLDTVCRWVGNEFKDNTNKDTALLEKLRKTR